jgi:hypothetical protein
LDLRTEIGQLNSANQTLTQDNQTCKDNLKAAENTLQQRMAELEEKEVLAEQQTDAFKQMQEP